MATARGIGLPIDGGGLAVPARARIYAQVQPITTGTANPGRADASGQGLHFRYEGNLNLGARSGGNQTPGAAPTPIDYVPNKIVVEFDAQSCITLPFEGQLTLVGGLGEWKFGMFVHDILDEQFYQPQFRSLSTFRRAGSTFVVPDFHTYILGINPAATFILPDTTVLAPSNVIPGTAIVPGTTLTVGGSSTRIVTGWIG